MIAAGSLLVDEQGAQSEPGSGPDKPSWPWPRAEQLKTRVAHAYCSRNLAAEACSYADICEQCDNFTTSVEFVPALTSAARRRHRPTRGRPSPRLGHRGLGRAATMGRTVCPTIPSEDAMILVFVLNHQKQDAQNSASDLSRQKIELESNIQTLKSQQNALQDQNSQLQKQGDDLRNRIGTLSGQL